MSLQQLVITLMFALVTVFADAAPVATHLEGQWLLNSDRGETYDLTLTYRESSATGNWHEQASRKLTLTALHGLDSAAFESAGARVAFEVRRDAGAFRCEGWARDGRASGHYAFVPDRGFARELDRLGFGAPSERELLSLALSTTGMDLVRQISQSKYDGVTVRQLVRSTHHGVTADYIRGLRDLGYRPDSLDGVVRMRDHGVTLDFIREVRPLGIDGLSDNEVIRLRDHGVTPDFIRGMRDAGFASLDARELVRLRDHGVTASYVNEIRSAGLTGVTVQEVVRLRDRGVTADDIRALKSK